jgi:hypothetical protein
MYGIKGNWVAVASASRGQIDRSSDQLPDREFGTQARADR